MFLWHLLWGILSSLKETRGRCCLLTSMKDVLALELNSNKIKAEWNLAQDIPKRRWDAWKIQEGHVEHVTKIETCQHTDGPLWYDFPWSPHSVQRVFPEVLTFLGWNSKWNIGWSRLVGLFHFSESMPQPPKESMLRKVMTNHMKHDHGYSNNLINRPLGKPLSWGIYPWGFHGLAKQTSVGSDWIKRHTFSICEMTWARKPGQYDSAVFGKPQVSQIVFVWVCL